MAVHVFDAYGTLLDVQAAVRRLSGRIGPRWEAIAAHTRQRQLEYTWVRSLGQFPWRDFRDLTADAFRHALAVHGVAADSALERDMIELYDRLDAYPDVAPALQRLRGEGARLAVLSNGTHAMLAGALDHAGIADLFERVVSVDDLKVYKTAPTVYAYCCRLLDTPPAGIRFYSSNRWDIAATAQCGFIPMWVNRAGAPDEYLDLPPRHVIRGLAELPGV